MPKGKYNPKLEEERMPWPEDYFKQDETRNLDKEFIAAKLGIVTSSSEANLLNPASTGRKRRNYGKRVTG